MEIDDAQIRRYEEIAKTLSSFESGEELIKFVLDEVAEELEERSTQMTNQKIEDSTIEGRLEDLGYLE